MQEANQSQKHGFIIENEIREKVFNLCHHSNDINIHDIPYDQNTLNSNENISIKATGGSTIFCGDILRFFDYDFTKINTIICVKYGQFNDFKVIKNIFEIDYNMDCHKMLYGNMPREVIKSYVDNVKSIPRNVKGDEAKAIFNYIEEKKKLQSIYDCKIQINPKVDSSQSRVQCSIPNFEKTLENFITYKSDKLYPNRIRGKDICLSIPSGKRIRKSPTILAVQCASELLC
jgi:hypothetical protein